MSYGLATIVVRKNYNVLQRSYTTLRYLFLTPTVDHFICNHMYNVYVYQTIHNHVPVQTSTHVGIL